MKLLIKLFWRLVSNRFLIQEWLDHTHILNHHLYYDDNDELYVKRMLSEYIEPEMRRREL